MIKNLILDLDGVLVKDKKLTPFDDAPQFINEIKKLNINFTIATNNTLYSPSELISILNKNNIKISEKEIITPLLVAPNYLKGRNIKDIFVIGSKNLIEFFKRKGFNVINSKDVQAVVIGQDKDLNFEKIKIATSAVKFNDAEILALNANLITKDDDGLVFAGVGSIAHMIAYATKSNWIHFGKNSTEYNKQLLNNFKNKDNIAIISDDIFTDLIPFSKLGIRTIFITTGKYKLKDIPPEFKPDFIANSLTEILDFIL